MQVTTQTLVTGCKSFKGDVEGKHYDSTTLFVLMDVSDRNGNAVGQNVVEMKFGDSTEFAKLKDLKFPVVSELGLKLTTKGYEVTSFKGVRQATQGAA